MNTLQFEKEVIEYFAPKYGFRDGEFWGIVSHSGTDGNAHGIYFGCTYLKSKSDINGRMIPEELEKVLDPNRPAFGQRLGINTVHERIFISLPFACLAINDIIFSPVDFAAFASGTNDIVEIGSITAIGPCK